MSAVKRPWNQYILHGLGVLANLVLLTFFIVSLCSCGDNIKHPQLWQDAQEVWAESWCEYYERCQPGLFEDRFMNQKTCQADVLELNCDKSEEQADGRQCENPYPADRLLDLAQCSVDMKQISCTTSSPPNSCSKAFSK